MTDDNRHRRPPYLDAKGIPAISRLAERGTSDATSNNSNAVPLQSLIADGSYNSIHMQQAADKHDKLISALRR
jgi:hypothetical protein